jgi:hypothetical protein
LSSFIKAAEVTQIQKKKIKIFLCNSKKFLKTKNTGKKSEGGKVIKIFAKKKSVLRAKVTFMK